MSMAYVARQPIFDRQGQVVAYELLQRNAPGKACSGDDDDMTRAVTAKALVDFGFDELVGKHDAFVNVPSAFLASDTYRALPSANTVLEVLERVVVTSDLIVDVRRARAAGYRVALDDYIGESRFDRLLPEVDVVKVDLVDVPKASLGSMARHIRARAPHALLLGEKVETRDQHAALMALGFDLFQGYFFAQPIILNRRQIPVAPLTLLRLVAALSEADLDVAGVAAIVVNDPGLSYRLLRVANSASVGLGHRVESVERAATLMGAEHIRRAAFLAAATETDVPDAVSSLALTRAAMCEQIARQDGRNGPAAFTVGLFSLLDVVLQVPMTRAVEQLPLTDDVRAAIVGQTGHLGALLTEVIAYERGQPLPPRRVKTLAAAYAAAVAWSARFVEA